MIWAEIILIVIGIVMIGISFFITEKLSQQDLDQISMMNETNLKLISEKQTKEMKSKVEDALEDIFNEALVATKRGLEKETNDKIMAVSEYSDTVLEEINKSHNEITFLYSMLNDKQAETAQLVGNLQRITKQIRDMDVENTIARLKNATNHAMQAEKEFDTLVAPVVEVVDGVSPINETTNLKEFQDVMGEAPILSKKEQILLLYKEGKDEVEIAKTLDCGLGEVRLVLGLYNNEA